ncbi:MAG TPA: hypothetical protein VEW42_06570, partial [Candidatus Eisenbacteria bacterium]|nr:hypothetical protein [Candidatus Eisenbacteria bacterium]
AIRVLEQSPNRPVDLEKRALSLSAALLDLCLEDAPDSQRVKIKEEYGNGYNFAKTLLEKGHALAKMKEIIKAQKGDPTVTDAILTTKLGKHIHKVLATHTDKIHEINSHNLTVVAKLLGAPMQKGAGIYLDKKIGEKFEKGDTLFTLFSENEYNLKEAVASLPNFPIMKV